MEIGTVTGSVWATRKARELGGHTLLVVRTGTGKTVAADFVGAGAGLEGGDGTEGCSILLTIPRSFSWNCRSISNLHMAHFPVGSLILTGLLEQ